MLDIGRTEDDLLADIHAPACASRAPGPGGSGAPGDGHSWVLAGRTPDELLPVLTGACSRRYAGAARDHLSANLHYLVKKGLGNAFKWGNGSDAGKVLVVTTVMTDVGAVVKISDQGTGFEVTRVIEQFNRRDRYFVHGGSGLAHFQAASSVVSYADGGRTLLIRFLCEADRAGSRRPRGRLARTPGHNIVFTALAPGDHVEVKGSLAPDGVFAAVKIKLKAAEQLAIIEAGLQEVSGRGRTIRILNRSLDLPEETEITSAARGRLDFTALRAGVVVELSGRYTPAAGFLPVRVKVRSEDALESVEVQGCIEEINNADRTFTVVGLIVRTGDATELTRVAAVEGPATDKARMTGSNFERWR